MKSLFGILAVAVTLSAAPIDGGPCNGGGTAAQIAALSLGCNIGLYHVGTLTLPEGTDLDQYTISLSLPFENDRFLLARFSGELPSGIIRLEVSYNGNPIAYTHAVWGYIPKPVKSLSDPLLFTLETYGLSTVSVPGEVYYHPVVPEPSAYILCASALGLLALRRRQGTATTCSGPASPPETTR